MKVRSRITSSALLLPLAILVGILWLRSSESPPAVPEPTVYVNEEEWAKAARTAGSGIIRTEGGDNLPRELVVDQSVRLSPAGRSMLHSTLERMTAKLLAEIEREQAKPVSSVEDYRRTLELLVDYEAHRAMQDLLMRDAFLILRNGERNPPATPGADQISLAPFATSDGQTGRVLFLIRREARPSLLAAQTALIDVMREERSQRLLFWNGQPEAVRKAWVEDHLALQARVEAKGLADLAPEELRRFIDQQTELRFLEARPSTGSWSLISK